ncbi:hypothetical protein NKH47_24685 [Mesorhizobium sp. M1060]|uniref:hypothetical protein n=1 Tax=unclassified Mesorhizobium TaxID=325217 RepID=UPI0003FA87F8|nr:hypothetical protein [Mesorhizobium sp. L2C089B000]
MSVDEAKPEEAPPTTIDSQGLVKSAPAKSIKLPVYRFAGFSAGAGREGDTIPIFVKLATTSDAPLFHTLVAGLNGGLTHEAAQIGAAVNLARANTVLLVCHADQSADLYVDTTGIRVEMRVKRSVQAGSPVFERDITDVRAMGFIGVEFKPDDGVLVCFREGWKFALYFDLSRDNGAFDEKEMGRTLGALFRALRYDYLYDALGNEAFVANLFKAGWFPFAEIITAEFREIMNHLTAGFDMAEIEGKTIKAFDRERLEFLEERWRAVPVLKDKMAILKSGLDSFLRGDAVAAIKTLSSEIEGILQEAHITIHGKGAKIDSLSEFAKVAGVTKAEGDDTLMFPNQFGQYLGEYIYAPFDPKTGASAAAGRHPVGHGNAKAEAYTLARALQYILTIDQLAFYLG